MLRTLLLLLLAALPAGTVRAQTDAPVYLVVSMANGDLHEYELAQKPAVAFLGATLKVTSGQIEQDFPAEEVTGFHFSLTSTDINRAEGHKVVRLRFTDNDHVVLGGLPAGRVRLFSAAGRLMRTVTVSEGAATVNLSGLASGSYVLAAEGMSSIKISKK